MTKNLELFSKITKGFQFDEKEINQEKVGFLNVYLKNRVLCHAGAKNRENNKNIKITSLMNKKPHKPCLL